MANDLNARPIRIDTTFATGAQLGRVAKVRKVYWFQPATTSDTFSITEKVSGKTLLQGKAEAALQSQVFDFASKPLILPKSSDWNVSITSGTLFIYTE